MLITPHGDRKLSRSESVDLCLKLITPHGDRKPGGSPTLYRESVQTSLPLMGIVNDDFDQSVFDPINSLPLMGIVNLSTGGDM